MQEAFRKRGIDRHAESIIMYSLICSSHRLESLTAALDLINDVEGDTAEIGCAGGGTSKLIALLNGGRRHWACDTFDGLKDTGEYDDLKDGEFSSKRCTAPIVSDRLAEQSNAVVVAGYFPDSAPEKMKSATYAFAHLDVDTYKSMHAAFSFFDKRMSSGAVLALDDVLGSGTRGAKRAWQEISAGTNRWRLVSENDPQIVIQCI